MLLSSFLCVSALSHPAGALTNMREFDNTLRSADGYLVEGESYVSFNIFSDQGIKEEWNYHKKIHFDKGRFIVSVPQAFFDGKHYLTVTADIPDRPPVQTWFLLPRAMTLPGYLGILLGALFILFYALMKFNTWPEDAKEKYSMPPRYFTTFTRYATYSLVYALFTEAFFCIIVLCPDVFISLNASLGGPKDIPFMEGFKKDSALWAVFLVTGVLPVFPWINRLELKLRKTLHKMAFIPIQAKSAIKYTFCSHLNRYCNPAPMAR